MGRWKQHVPAAVAAGGLSHRVVCGFHHSECLDSGFPGARDLVWACERQLWQRYLWQQQVPDPWTTGQPGCWRGPGAASATLGGTVQILTLRANVPARFRKPRAVRTTLCRFSVNPHNSPVGWVHYCCPHLAGEKNQSLERLRPLKNAESRI